MPPARSSSAPAHAIVSSFVAAAIDVAAEVGSPPDELLTWRDHESPEPVVRRATLVGGLVSWLRTAASQRPIIAVIDDAHWLDDDTIAVLLDVIGGTREIVRWIIASRAIDRHPAAARLRDELERGGAVCSVSLGALTIDDVHELRRPARSRLWTRSVGTCWWRR